MAHRRSIGFPEAGSLKCAEAGQLAHANAASRIRRLFHSLSVCSGND